MNGVKHEIDRNAWLMSNKRLDEGIDIGLQFMGVHHVKDIKKSLLQLIKVIGGFDLILSDLESRNGLLYIGLQLSKRILLLMTIK